jgi:hypothetical protein
LVPTKRRRHAITETPPVQEALDALRAELDDERPDLSELVILGARQKLSSLRAVCEDRDARVRRLTDRIRRRELGLDPALADEAKGASLPG